MDLLSTFFPKHFLERFDEYLCKNNIDRRKQFLFEKSSDVIKRNTKIFVLMISFLFIFSTKKISECFNKNCKKIPDKNNSDKSIKFKIFSSNVRFKTFIGSCNESTEYVFVVRNKDPKPNNVENNGV